MDTLNNRCRTIIGTQKRDHNFDNHPCVIRIPSSGCTWTTTLCSTRRFTRTFALMRGYVCTYICMHAWMDIYTYIMHVSFLGCTESTHTYLPTYLPTYVPPYPPAPDLPTSLHTYRHTYIHTHTHIHPYVDTYMHTYVPCRLYVLEM